MFSFACTALFMKPESQGWDCVHLSVSCSTLLVPLCHMSFYLAAHQPTKSLCAYIIVLLERDVLQNVLHFPMSLFFLSDIRAVSLSEVVWVLSRLIQDPKQLKHDVINVLFSLGGCEESTVQFTVWYCITSILAIIHKRVICKRVVLQTLTNFNTSKNTLE